jgi:hypothetical protein
MDDRRDPDDVDGGWLQWDLLAPSGYHPDAVRHAVLEHLGAHGCGGLERDNPTPEPGRPDSGEDPRASTEVKHLESGAVGQERNHRGPPPVQHAVGQSSASRVPTSDVRTVVVDSGHRWSIHKRRLNDQCRRALDAVTAAVVLRRSFLALANVRVRGHPPAHPASTGERHEDRRNEPHHT